MAEGRQCAAVLRTGGCILAGGAATRMQGQDKGLVAVGSSTLCALVLARLAPQVEAVAISANRNLGSYRRMANHVIEDQLGGFLGPLAGMHAALSGFGQDFDALAFVPCDAPNLPLDLVDRLSRAMSRSEAAYALVNGRAHPTFCLLRPSLCARIEAALRGNQRRVLGLLESVGAIAVGFDHDAKAFANLNSSAEVAQFFGHAEPDATGA